MQCITPMIRQYELGNYKKGHIVPRNTIGNELTKNPQLIRFYLDKINAKSNRFQYETIPCSKCYACRLNYSAEWATRIMLESKYYNPDECWFITLTYDDNNINIPKIVYCNETREFYRNDGTWTGTLELDEIQKFIKRLRDHFNYPDMKYFYCGEYGSGETMRPHYHLILLGVPLNALEFYSSHIDKKFFKEHWKSHEIDKLWNKSWQEDGTSINDIANVEWNSIAYTARYCMKKIGEDYSETSYKKLGKIPEFVNMSKNIGLRYYQDHKDEIWKTDSITLTDWKGKTLVVKPPKYFMKLLEKEDPEKARIIKNKRKEIGTKLRHNQERQSDYTDLEMLLIKAEKTTQKAKELPREL